MINAILLIAKLASFSLLVLAFAFNAEEEHDAALHLFQIWSMVVCSLALFWDITNGVPSQMAMNIHLVATIGVIVWVLYTAIASAFDEKLDKMLEEKLKERGEEHD